MSPEIQEADVVPEPGTDIAPVAGGALAVTTPVQAGDLVERLDTIKEAMNTAMERDVDYGVIPGTNKPTLLKPGAEKLGVLFQLDMQITHEERWGPGDHLTVSAAAIVFHAPTGTRLGRGEGMCSTREKKYAKRNAGLSCPTCGKENVRKSKNGDGFYCWAKTGGCGGQFPADDERITSQTPGEIDNPDLPDLWNTIIKMARKRAQTDAVLLVTGASALFTQDIEDSTAPAAEAARPPFGPPASAEVATSARKAVAWSLGDAAVNSESVSKVLGSIERRAGGYMPDIAARAIGHVAAAARTNRETRAAGEVIDETPEEREEREHGERLAADAAADEAARIAAEEFGKAEGAS